MKKSKSKYGYHIYSPSSLRFKKLMVKSGRKDMKKATIPDLANVIFNSPVANNLDKHLLVAEVLWDHAGRKVVFPGDSDFFTKLLNSNFALGGGAILNLPESSFILAMPKGFEINGVPIPSVIVNYCKASNRVTRYKHATELMRMREMEHQEGDLAGHDNLCFFYQSPDDEEGVVVQVNQTPLQVAGALKANSANEYASILGEIPQELVSPVATTPTQTDHIIQFVITKIIAGISVYMSANEIAHFNEGLPDSGRLAISNLKSDVRYSFFHLPSPNKSSNILNEAMTTRSFHFRQLKDERYYRNEFKDAERGSRWVFVKEAQVGRFKALHLS